MRKKFGDYLMSAIDMADLSQKEAADAINVSAQTLNNYIHNKRTPDVETLCHIMRYFNLDANIVLNIKQEDISVFELSDEEMRLIREYRKLDDEHQKFSRFILDNLPKSISSPFLKIEKKEEDTEEE